MITKYIELRDDCTCMPIKIEAIDPSDEIEAKFYAYAGFGTDSSIRFMTLLETEDYKYDPYHWEGDWLAAVHSYLRKNFESLENGQVVDMRVVRGEEEKPVSAAI